MHVCSQKGGTSDCGEHLYTEKRLLLDFKILSSSTPDVCIVTLSTSRERVQFQP